MEHENRLFTDVAKAATNRVTPVFLVQSPHDSTMTLSFNNVFAEKCSLCPSRLSKSHILGFVASESLSNEFL